MQRTQKSVRWLTGWRRLFHWDWQVLGQLWDRKNFSGSRRCSADACPKETRRDPNSRERWKGAMAPFGLSEDKTGRKGLRDAVWSVGTNLPKQVGVDWALPSCRGVGRAITSTPLHPTPEMYMLARPVCQPITHTAELPVVYHVFGGCPRRFH